MALYSQSVWVADASLWSKIDNDNIPIIRKCFYSITINGSKILQMELMAWGEERRREQELNKWTFQEKNQL